MSYKELVHAIKCISLFNPEGVDFKEGFRTEKRVNKIPCFNSTRIKTISNMFDGTNSHEEGK